MIFSADRLKHRPVVVAIALVCCFLWGSAVPVVKHSYDVFAISPSDTPSLMLFAGARFALAGLFLLLAAGLSRRRLIQPAGLMSRLLLLGLVSTAGQYLFYYIGLAHASGVKVSIVTATSTFFSVLLAHLLFANDRLSWRRSLGCAIGFAGVVVVNLGASPLDGGFSLFGEGFILIAAMLFSIGTIYGRRISQTMDTGLMTGWQLFLGGMVLVVAGFALGGRFEIGSLEGVVILGYLAAISAVAFSLWGLLLKHNPVGVVAIFNCVIPIFGITLSGLILGETVLRWNNLLALAMVTAGIFLVTAQAGARTRLRPQQPG